jgi:myo-inositol-1(or 4)-monophosphatase
VCEWAQVGGAIARRYFHAVTAQRKADQSSVTQADIEIEAFLRERISQHYPSHGIVGEEQGIGQIDHEYVWALDPLDGTDAFVSGLPVWGVSIGLIRAGQPYLGVVYLPIPDECYWNEPGGQAFCNGEVIHVNPASTYDEQDVIMIPSRSHREYDVQFAGKARSLGSFAAHCCYVARGSVLGALLGHPQIWDIAAGLAILQAAGGTAVTLSQHTLDVRPLLDGSKPQEPLFISTPALTGSLLQSIRVKGTV